MVFLEKNIENHLFRLLALKKTSKIIPFDCYNLRPGLIHRIHKYIVVLFLSIYLIHAVNNASTKFATQLTGHQQAHGKGSTPHNLSPILNIFLPSSFLPNSSFPSLLNIPSLPLPSPLFPLPSSPPNSLHSPPSSSSFVLVKKIVIDVLMQHRECCTVQCTGSSEYLTFSIYNLH